MGWQFGAARSNCSISLHIFCSGAGSQPLRPFTLPVHLVILSLLRVTQTGSSKLSERWSAMEKQGPNVLQVHAYFQNNITALPEVVTHDHRPTHQWPQPLEDSSFRLHGHTPLAGMPIFKACLCRRRSISCQFSHSIAFILSEPKS